MRRLFGKADLAAGNFAAESGWTGSGTFSSGQSVTIGRGAADLGSGPSIVVFGNFRGGTPGNAVPAAQQIGTFNDMIDTAGDVVQPPFYETGPDGDTWMGMVTTALQNSGSGEEAQANVSTLPDFTSFYCSFQNYRDGPSTPSNANVNEKTIWVTRDADVTSGGHDFFFQFARNVGSNSGGGTWYWGGTGSDGGGLPPEDGFGEAGNQTFISWGLKPHTTAANDALIDAFMQQVRSGDRTQRSTTGLQTAWHSAGITPAWNYVYFVGYYQMRGATPATTYYRVKDFYFAIGDNAQKRFFLTDASTLAATRKLFDCPHTAWAANSVTIYLPYTGASIAGMRLWYGDWMTYTLVGTVS